MGHRKWSPSVPFNESLTALQVEHNTLYDAWEVERDRVKDAVEEKHFAEGQCARLSWLAERAEKDLDEARSARDKFHQDSNDLHDLKCSLEDELDEARKRIAELESPTRVPMDIEAMARAACEGWVGADQGYGLYDDHPDHSKDKWRDAIRAALAAGGLEPCAVPEYDPADVALMPTGTVLRDRLVEAEAKIERQRAELEKLNHLRQLEAGERAVLRDELEAVKAERDKYRESSAKAYVEAEDLRNELTALSECVSVDPPADQVEAMARVMHKSQDAFYCRYGDHATKFDDHTPLWSTMARAAIAHLAKRPEGLPSMRDLREIGVHAYLSHDSAKRENAVCIVDPMGAAADAILTALRPWLREPVGWELDVTAEEAAMAYKENVGGDGLLYGGLCAMLALCRLRIRPVYECKECANKEAELRRHNDKWTGFIQRCQADAQNARAALEGE